MSDLAEAPAAVGTAEWGVWSTTVRVVVTDPAVLPGARALVVRTVASVDAAASRFRSYSEVSRIAARSSDGPVRVSPLLADLLGTALDAARRTDGDVDPTLGADLVRLGYDRDLTALPAQHPDAAPVTLRRPITWRDVTLDGRTLCVPRGVLLDLGATAKARTADLCAVAITERFGGGALVSLGGDLRVSGTEPDDGWQILVQDGPAEPASRIRLTGRDAVATSSTLHRVWRRGRATLHHILDPVHGSPAPTVWRTVSVAAATCVAANTLTTAAMIRGHRAPDLLERSGLPARLVAADGTVVRLGGWPA